MAPVRIRAAPIFISLKTLVVSDHGLFLGVLLWHRIRLVFAVISGNPLFQSEYKSEKRDSVMKNLYVDIDRKEQGVIINELLQEIGLSSRKLAKTLGWNRSSLLLYLKGKSRIPYLRFLDLCRLANVDASKYILKFVIIERQKGKKLDLSDIDESQFQTLKPVEWQKVVAAGILTDGYLYFRKFDNKYQIRFFSSDLNMHSFFQKTILFAFGENCSALLKIKGQNLWTTFYTRGTKNPMLEKLLSFSKTYSTTKGNCPSLDFLLKGRNQTKVEALRFAMSCDGSISCKKTRSGKKCFVLRLACANPQLVLQWQKLFQEVGIKMGIDKDKNTWSGIHGLVSGKKDSIKKFAEIGGFLPKNVKVTNGKLVGKLKNEVLNMALENNN